MQWLHIDITLQSHRRIPKDEREQSDHQTYTPLPTEAYKIGASNTSDYQFHSNPNCKQQPLTNYTIVSLHIAIVECRKWQSDHQAYTPSLYTAYKIGASNTSHYQFHSKPHCHQQNSYRLHTAITPHCPRRIPQKWGENRTIEPTPTPYTQTYKIGASATCDQQFHSTPHFKQPNSRRYTMPSLHITVAGSHTVIARSQHNNP